MREQVAADSAAAKAAKDAQLAEENAAMRNTLENTTGRDEKGLSAETLAMREKAAADSAAAKAAHDARLAEQNAAMRNTLQNTTGRDEKGSPSRTQPCATRYRIRW